MARTHTDYRVTFVVLATAALAFSLLQSLIIPAIPQLEHTLHTSESGASWLLTAYLLSAAIATPILGRVGDMIGKERVIVAVLIALSVGSLISALATTLPVMLVGRVIQGAAGAVFPLAFGIIRDEFPADGWRAPSASCRPSSAPGPAPGSCWPARSWCTSTTTGCSGSR